MFETGGDERTFSTKIRVFEMLSYGDREFTGQGKKGNALKARLPKGGKRGTVWVRDRSEWPRTGKKKEKKTKS